MNDPSGVTTYAYDARDRLLLKATAFGTLGYAWDAAGNLAEMASSNTNGVWTTYTWDEAYRLASVRDERLDETSLFEYDAAGNPARVTYGNALQTDITRDLLHRVTRQEIGNAVPPAAFDYTLDATGRRTSLTGAEGRTAAYTYDDAYKLTREDVTGDPGGNGALDIPPGIGR